MPNPVEFYFDFSSPYGYIASDKIDALAAKHRREVTWKPFLLGPVFKATGQARYADDLKLPRMVFCRLLRSTAPHARVLAVDTSRAEALPGVS